MPFMYNRALGSAAAQKFNFVSLFVDVASVIKEVERFSWEEPAYEETSFVLTKFSLILIYNFS